MIRECSINDRELLSGYLSSTAYGRAILKAADAYGFDKMFQTIYADIDIMQEEEGSREQVRGVYLWIYRNLLVYSGENRIDIDFLEQMMGIAAPVQVAGRKDNVNIVSWLLTDYRMTTDREVPEITDDAGNRLGCFEPSEELEAEWTRLVRTE